MAKAHKPRKGSLQFWPRKRASKLVPRVNWKPLEAKYNDTCLLGFLGYKVGMCSVLAKDLTEHSMTKGKKIVVPASIVECPPMKILAVRFYKHGKAACDVLSCNLDKELKRKLKLPQKQLTKEHVLAKLNEIEQKLDELGYDNVRLLVYSLVKKTKIKKKPDIAEIAVGGKNIKEKLAYIKELIGKEINVKDVLKPDMLIDVRGVTKGKGTQGPIKRFGIGRKQHKSEKGVRRPGSIGPWTPKKVSFRAPMAGQLGFFTRIQYNNKMLDIANINEKDINPKSGWMHYGLIKSGWVMLKGSVQGPPKRPLMLTYALRPTKRTEKLKLDVLEIIR